MNRQLKVALISGIVAIVVAGSVLEAFALPQMMTKNEMIQQVFFFSQPRV
jgi:hypothetical protein